MDISIQMWYPYKIEQKLSSNSKKVSIAVNFYTEDNENNINGKSLIIKLSLNASKQSTNEYKRLGI